MNTVKCLLESLLYDFHVACNLRVYECVSVWLCVWVMIQGAFYSTAASCSISICVDCICHLEIVMGCKILMKFAIISRINFEKGVQQCFSLFFHTWDTDRQTDRQTDSEGH